MGACYDCNWDWESTDNCAGLFVNYEQRRRTANCTGSKLDRRTRPQQLQLLHHGCRWMQKDVGEATQQLWMRRYLKLCVVQERTRLVTAKKTGESELKTGRKVG